MIRPITFICFVMALGSGLYLYQSKHTAQMLDHLIEKTARDTDAVREQTRALKTEWTLLNEPDRLRQLSEQYLPALKPLAPTQFTTLADLNSRLPAPQAIAPEPAPVAEPPAVAAADGAAQAGSVVADAAPANGTAADSTPSDTTLADAADAMPVPPIPPQPPAAVAAANAQVASIQPAPVPPSAAVARPPDRKPGTPVIRPVALAGPSPRVASSEPKGGEPRASEARAPEPRPFETRAAETRTAESRPVDLRGPEQPRLTDYRTMTAPRPARPAPTPPSQGGGSLLGMARGPDNLPPPLPMPLPRPTPVSAWANNWPNGG